MKADNIRVALLTNCVSPHSISMWEQMSTRVKDLRTFASAALDKYHGFPRVQTSLNVEVQKSFNWLRIFRRTHGAWEEADLHIPYDTYARLASYRPDCILSLQFGIRTLLACLYRKLHPSSRLIVWAPLSMRAESKRIWLRRVARRWILRIVDGAFVNGREGEKYLRCLGYRGRCFTVPYAIDGTLFLNHQYSPHPGRIRLIYAGRLIPQKGIRQFCIGLAQWCAAHPSLQVDLQIAGEGREEAAIRAIPLPGNLRFEFLGKLSQQALAARYRQADLFVIPTLDDEWGVVVNEAMLAGLPILGSVHSQAVLELVEEGTNGWRFDSENQNSIYASLDRALTSSRSKLVEMSAAARATIAALSPEAIAARAIQAFEQVTASVSEERCMCASLGAE